MRQKWLAPRHPLGFSSCITKSQIQVAFRTIRHALCFSIHEIILSSLCTLSKKYRKTVVFQLFVESQCIFNDPVAALKPVDVQFRYSSLLICCRFVFGDITSSFLLRKIAAETGSKCKIVQEL